MTPSKRSITPEAAESLKTVLIATKASAVQSYHPAYRTLSVVLDGQSAQAAVQNLPGFLICESASRMKMPDGTQRTRSNLYFRVGDFDEAIAAYTEPLDD